MNNKIEALIKDDYMLILEDIEKSDPEEFKKSVLENRGDESLFISFFLKDDRLTFISKLLPKFEKYGYSIMSENKSLSKKTILSTIVMENKEKIPDILYAIINTRNDDTCEFMLKHIGEKNILKLEQDGWPLFKIIAKKTFIKSAKYLATTESDFNLTENEKITTLSEAEKNKQILSIYWGKMNKEIPGTHMPDNEFYHFNTLIKNKADSIYIKNSMEVSIILGLLETHKERLVHEQKIQLLKSTLSSVDKTLFKETLKLFKFKLKDEDVHNMLLLNLREAGKMEYGYLFLNEKDFLKKTGFMKNGEDIVLKHAINNIDDLLKDLFITLDTRVRFKTKEDKFVSAVMNRLRSSIGELGYEFLFNNLEGTQKTLFEGLTEKNENRFRMVSLMEVANISTNSASIFKFKSITPDTIYKLKNKTITLDEKQKEELQYLLEKTWFKKEEDNSMYIEKYDPWQLTRKHIELLNPLLCFPVMKEEQKFRYLKWCISNIQNITVGTKSNDDYIGINFDNIYREFKENPNFNWKSLNIDMKKLEIMKNSEIYFEIKALIMKSELEENLNNTASVKKRNKI